MEKLITRKEAARILGISIATLDAARNNGLISYVQYVQNGCVYFTDMGHPPGKTDGKECDLPQDPERRSMSQSVSLLELKISDKTKIQRWRLF